MERSLVAAQPDPKDNMEANRQVGEDGTEVSWRAHATRRGEGWSDFPGPDRPEDPQRLGDWRR